MKVSGRTSLPVISAPCFYSQAETRAEFAERSVAKLEKTIDDLEGKRDLPCTPKLHPP